MKTSELIGPALDWAVAKCEGIAGEITRGGFILFVKDPAENPDLFCPSTDWAQGGPIIEREGICLYSMDAVAPWDARIYEPDAEPWQAVGDTPLIAAMRCYVASKLGDEVDVPEELK